MPVAPPMAKPNDRRRSRRDRDVGFRPLGKLEQIASLGRVRSYELRQVAEPRPFRGGCHPGNYTVRDAMLKVMAESVRSAGFNRQRLVARPLTHRSDDQVDPRSQPRPGEAAQTADFLIYATLTTVAQCPRHHLVLDGKLALRVRGRQHPDLPKHLRRLDLSQLLLHGSRLRYRVVHLLAPSERSRTRGRWTLNACSRLFDRLGIKILGPLRGCWRTSPRPARCWQQSCEECCRDYGHYHGTFWRRGRREIGAVPLRMDWDYHPVNMCDCSATSLRRAEFALMTTRAAAWSPNSKPRWRRSSARKLPSFYPPGPWPTILRCGSWHAREDACWFRQKAICGTTKVIARRR